MLYNFPFITVGFRKECYYWEFVTISRKILLISILVFLSDISQSGRLVISFFVLIGYGLLNFAWNPYDGKTMNHLESFAIFGASGLCVCGIYYLNPEDKNSDVFGIFLSIAAVGSYIIFFVVSIFAYSKSLGYKVKKI